MYDLSEEINLEKNIKDKIDIVIDRIVIKENIRTRLFESIELATNKSDGKVIVDVVGEKEVLFSTKYACPECNYSLPELEPRLFSFNSPYGACPECKGLGTKLKIDADNTAHNMMGGIKARNLEMKVNHVNNQIKKKLMEYNKLKAQTTSIDDEVISSEE